MSAMSKLIIKVGSKSREVVPIKQAAILLDRSLISVYRDINEGRLDEVDIYDLRLVTVESVERFKSSLRPSGYYR